MPDSSRDFQASAEDDWSALMVAAQDGDRHAYRRLLMAVTPYVRAFAARAFRERADVEDAVQDILMTLHETRRFYDPSRPFRPWIAAIARHRIIDRQRARGRRTARETPLGPEHETFAAAATNMQNAAADGWALRSAVAALPAGQREAVELLKLHELTLKQAAALTGQSVVALKVATHRGLKRLRRMLGDPA